MAGKMADELRCPTCLNIFNDPVMLKCSHSFCRKCVKQWWKHKKIHSCPVCRKTCQASDASLNLTLKNVCETYTQDLLDPEAICSLHEEKKKLFCLDHQECVCLICRDAQIHAGHKFCSLEDAALDPREKVQNALQKVKKTQQDFIMVRDNCREQAEYIKVQQNQVESKIKKSFKELRDFLQTEEAAKLVALKEEAQRKSQMMQEKIGVLRKGLAALSGTIQTTEKQLSSNQVSFMNNYQNVMSKIQQLPDKPKMPSGALLDEVKHLGNLKFTVWKQMKEMVSYSPVILDPNTASPQFSLSEDLTSVSLNVKEERPANMERYGNRVLGSALNLGTHVWDVEVGDNTNWVLGVVGGDSCLPHSSFVWGISFCDDKYKIVSLPYQSKNLPVKEKVQRIRVHVDTRTRSLSFSDSLTNTELYTRKNIPNWPNLSGEWTMYPYLYTNDKGPLKIIPLTLYVTTEIQK
ncbi:E3 ubiquitin-protein ligase TRIM35-like [Hippocampus zosterae]|uniref:E3 ubiquitin-protein ligase TRIM35-like n=1 Tax=Hippocampus zosterae TaxID=109293 RepID=UPI00223E762C|nr:E3 ubiquitin-protein ligase TRIM35-like [Hippocampus zosterae]XP_051942773.1 E3 ubiquitin-protein ligase TRIM35-like [Hippocampus zosterae]